MNYKHVYFRIECGYCSGNDNTEKCLQELQTLFASHGWEIAVPRTPGNCPEVKLRKMLLYCHPTQISGPVELEMIPVIEGILREGKEFRYYKADIYEDLLDITKEQLPEHYKKTWGKTMPGLLLDAFRTNRRNLYKSVDDVMGVILDKIRVKTVENQYPQAYNKDAVDFVKGHIDALIATGQLITATGKGGRNIARSATAADNTITPSLF